MTHNIDTFALTAHVKETVAKTCKNALETHEVMGPGWMEESIKVDIAWAASHQDFISFDDYVLVAMDLLRRALERMVA